MMDRVEVEVTLGEDLVVEEVHWVEKVDSKEGMHRVEEVDLKEGVHWVEEVDLVVKPWEPEEVMLQGWKEGIVAVVVVVVWRRVGVNSA